MALIETEMLNKIKSKHSRYYKFLKNLDEKLIRKDFERLESVEEINDERKFYRDLIDNDFDEFKKQYFKNEPDWEFKKISAPLFVEFYSNIEKYHLLIRNEKINIFEYKNLERLSDDIKNVVIENEKKKYAKSFLSKKYYHLVDQDILDAFYQIKLLDIPHKEVNSHLSKLAAVKKTVDLNDLVLSVLSQYTNHTMESIKKLCNVKNISAKEIFSKDGMLALQIDDYDASKALGSPKWCISYEEQYFNQYIHRDDYVLGEEGSIGIPNKQLFIWNFNLPCTDDNHLIGMTIKPDQSVSISCDYNDKELNQSQYKEYLSSVGVDLQAELTGRLFNDDDNYDTINNQRAFEWSGNTDWRESDGLYKNMIVLMAYEYRQREEKTTDQEWGLFSELFIQTLKSEGYKPEYKKSEYINLYVKTTKELFMHISDNEVGIGVLFGSDRYYNILNILKDIPQHEINKIVENNKDIFSELVNHEDSSYHDYCPSLLAAVEKANIKSFSDDFKYKAAWSTITTYQESEYLEIDMAYLSAKTLLMGHAPEGLEDLLITTIDYLNKDSELQRKAIEECDTGKLSVLSNKDLFGISFALSKASLSAEKTDAIKGIMESVSLAGRGDEDEDTRGFLNSIDVLYQKKIISNNWLDNNIQALKSRVDFKSITEKQKGLSIFNRNIKKVKRNITI